MDGATDAVGRVVGTEDSTPLQFGVALDEGAYLQLDDVVADAMQVLGPKHPFTLTAQGNLAGCYWKGGRTIAALDLWERVADDMSRVLGPENVETLVVVEALREGRRQPGATEAGETRQ
jgi:hypothetical protein